MAKIKWNENGWTSLQEASSSEHVLEINCRTENGNVTEVRVRHHDGEEVAVKVLVNGAPALPMDIKTFTKHFEKSELEFKE